MNILNDFLISGAYIGLLVLLWLIGWKIFDLSHNKINLNHELTETDNTAVATSLIGYNIGLIFALGSLLTGGAYESLYSDMISLFSYGLLAIGLLNISGLINDKIIFRKVSTQQELLKSNKAVGFVEAGNYVANGLILYGALSGSGSIITALVFWGLGQLTLLLASYIYNLITIFDLNEHIAASNTAVGIAYSGFLVGISSVIRFGGQGDFVSWTENLTNYALIVVFSFIFLPIIRAILDLVILRHASLSKEIVEDKNTGIAGVEASFYVTASLLIGWVMSA